MPETKAAVEGVLVFGSGVIFVQLIVSLVMMRSVAKSARCQWCEHCRRAQSDEKERAARKRHESYHFFTDRAAAGCHNHDCPGRR